MAEIVKFITFFFPIECFPNELEVIEKIREFNQWAENPYVRLKFNSVMIVVNGGIKVIIKKIKDGVDEEMPPEVVNFFRNSNFAQPYIKKGARIETGPEGGK